MKMDKGQLDLIFRVNCFMENQEFVTSSNSPRIFVSDDIGGLSGLSSSYDVVVCDLWGTIHDGLKLFPAAVSALQRFRAATGGVVVLLSNSARPSHHIRLHLESMGMPRDCWDFIVTSGDVSVDLLCHRLEAVIFHLGPERDLVLYQEVERATGVRLHVGGLDGADLAVCTGTSGRNPREFTELFEAMAAQELRLLCANPDLVTLEGSGFAYCAGSLASLYSEMGGAVMYTGKPYKAIYEKVVARLAVCFPPKLRVLAVGDAFNTDILGATQFGWDALHVGYRLSERYLVTSTPEELSRLQGVRPELQGLIW